MSMSPARRTVSGLALRGRLWGRGCRAGSAADAVAVPLSGVLLERRVGRFLEVVQVSGFQAWTHPFLMHLSPTDSLEDKQEGE